MRSGTRSRSGKWRSAARAWLRRRSPIRPARSTRADRRASAPARCAHARESVPRFAGSCVARECSSNSPNTSRRNVALSSLHAHLVEPQRPIQRIAPDARHQLRASCDDPRLRTAEQFVAAERHQVDAFASSWPRPAVRRYRTASDRPGSRCPNPHIRARRAPCPSAASSLSDGRAVNPVMRKLLRCTRNSTRVDR